MKRGLEKWVLGFVGLLFLQEELLGSPKVEAADCFKAVFAFGDGVVDTGSISHIFPSLLNYDYPPYGSTHFGKPSGRMSDGRLVVDFLCEALGIPKLPSYAQTVSSDFSNGLSFGSAFATIGEVKTGQTAGPFMFLNPFSLPMQVSQYVEFRATTNLVHSGKTIPNTKRVLQKGEEDVEATTIEEVAHAKARLPVNEDFRSGLYLVSAGAHDIVNMYNQNFSTGHMEGIFGKLMGHYSLAIRPKMEMKPMPQPISCRNMEFPFSGISFPIYPHGTDFLSDPTLHFNELFISTNFCKYYGAKNVIVLDVEPLGCQPFLLTLLPHTQKDLDSKGCLVEVNALVQKFNKQLKGNVKSWRSQYGENILYVSQYDIKIDLINDAESGVNTTNVACCGVDTSPYNVNVVVPCGPAGFDPRTNTPHQPISCSSPSSHLYWDGFYTTEAANKYVAEKILSGKYSDIPFETLTSCAKRPLS